MEKLILLILISFIFSRNVILIGDSRFAGMANFLMGFPYTKVVGNYGSGSNIRRHLQNNIMEIVFRLLLK